MKLSSTLLSSSLILACIVTACSDDKGNSTNQVGSETSKEKIKDKNSENNKKSMELSAQQSGTDILVSFNGKQIKKIENAKLVEKNNSFISFEKKDQKGVLAGEKGIIHSCKKSCEVSISKSFASLKPKAKLLRINDKRIIDSDGLELDGVDTNSTLILNSNLQVKISDNFALFFANENGRIRGLVYQAGVGKILSCKGARCSVDITSKFATSLSFSKSKLVHHEMGLLYRCENKCRINISENFASSSSRLFGPDGDLISSYDQHKKIISKIKISDQYAGVEFSRGGGQLFHQKLGLLQTFREKKVKFVIHGKQASVLTATKQINYTENGEAMKTTQFDPSGRIIKRAEVKDSIEDDRQFYRDKGQDISWNTHHELRIRLHAEVNKTLNPIKSSRINAVIKELDSALLNQFGLYELYIKRKKEHVEEASQKNRKKCLFGETDAYYVYASVCLNNLKAEKDLNQKSISHPADAYYNASSILSSNIVTVYNFLAKTTKEEGLRNSISQADEDFLVEKIVENQEKSRSYYRTSKELVSQNPENCDKMCSLIDGTFD